MNFGTILLVIIFAIIGGIIIGALYTILSIMWNGRKAKREFKEGKAFEVKENPTQEIEQKIPKKPSKKDEKAVKEAGKIRDKLEKENSGFQKKWGDYIEGNQFTGTKEQYEQLQKDHQKLSQQFDFYTQSKKPPIPISDEEVMERGDELEVLKLEVKNKKDNKGFLSKFFGKKDEKEKRN